MCGGWGVPDGDELSPDDGGCGKKKATDAGIDKTKRGFTTAAMASPVLMSLLSKPAWSNVACSISGLTSGNVSSPGGVPGPCSGDGMGCTPGFWKNNPAAWFIQTSYSPGVCKTYQGQTCKEWEPSSGTTFKVAFGCSSGLSEDPTLMEVLQLAEKDNTSFHAFLAHCVAALLNASSAPASYGSTDLQIKEVVCAVIAGNGDVNGVDVTRSDLHATLELMNERDCIFNAHGYNCGADSVNNGEGECIPSCGGATQYDVNTKECVDKKVWEPGSVDADGVVTPGHCSIEDAINGEKWCDTTITL